MIIYDNSITEVYMRTWVD